MASQAINGSLEVRVGGKPAELGTLAPIHDRLCWQGNQIVVYWGLYPFGKGRDPWVIAPDVISSTGYVLRPLMINKKFHMWDYTQGLWGRINQDQLGVIWKDISMQTLGLI